MDMLEQIRAINATAAFNRWCGVDVVEAADGRAAIAMPWREEGGQYLGHLHTGIVAGLIDTACGYAAATLVGRVVASHVSVNCLRPAAGERFIARAHVVKPGKTTVFTSCELVAVKDGKETLVATGETMFSVVGG